MARTGYRINPQLKKVVDGGPYDGQALDVNNNLCSVTGLPQDTMANPSDSPDYRVLDASCNECFLELSYTVENESETTATVTVNVVSGGTGPYTYLWSNGQTTQTATGLIKDTEYTVQVTDTATSCVQEGAITPNVEILTGLKMEMLYFNTTTGVPSDDLYYPRINATGHSCNRARFEVFTNGVSQGIANLNNAGPPAANPWNVDDNNIPPGVYAFPNVTDRYWSKILTGEDAAEIADSEGKVDITLQWTGAGNTIGEVPHSDACWFRISKEDGTILLSTTVDLFSSYEFDPYA